MELTGHIDSCCIFPSPWGEDLLLIEGWLLHPEYRIESLTLNRHAHDDLLIRSKRPDVASMISSITHAADSGFVALVPDMTSLPLAAVIETGEQINVSIPITKDASRPGEDPVMLALGRLRTREIFDSIAAALLKKFLQSEKVFAFRSRPGARVSAVIPVYNKAGYTLLALWSLFRQSFDDLEVVVVDNGSTDDTDELLSKIPGLKTIKHAENLHFLRGSNSGAEAAAGEFLLFMNNDCIAHPNAVERLAHHFDDPRVGLAGALLVNPPGVIQEAGSRILFDGSTIGIYRYGDPRDAGPPREVDYCSGAFIMTPRKLFFDCGKFSEAYAPAYGEDADYALTVRGKGFSVICETGSSVLHAEHGSAVRRGEVTALIERSKSILKSRHPAFFSWKPVSKTTASDRHVVFIDDLAPVKTGGQGLPRSNLMLHHLLDLGFAVTMIAVTEVDRPEPHLSHEKVRLVTNIPRAGLPAALGTIPERIQGIIVSRPPNMEALLQSGAGALAPILYDAESVFALRDITKRELETSTAFSKDEIDEVVEKEVRIARGVKAILAVSCREASHFQSHGIENVSVLSYGIDAVLNSPGPAGRSGLLTVGPVVRGDSPNFDGSQWFSREVLPLIRSRTADWTDYTIAGSMLPSLKSYYDALMVRITGMIEDLKPAYDAARVFIAPTRFAAGIPLKVVEAAAFGLPSVVTPLLAAQLGWKDGQDLLVGTDAQDFANKTLMLQKDDDLWVKISRNALERVKAEYSVKAFREVFSAALVRAGILPEVHPRRGTR